MTENGDFDGEPDGKTGRPRPSPLGWDFEDHPKPVVDGPPVVTLEPNRKGRDLIVSDIHGQRETFERLLKNVRYDPRNGDRLLLLGDLIDRGPDSHGMLAWLQREDVFCIRGNHEQMMIDAFTGHRLSEALWIERNGGVWSRDLNAREKETWLGLASSLPLAAEVETPNGIVALAHAELPLVRLARHGLPWWALKEWLGEGDRCASFRVLWSRERYSYIHGKDPGVPDVWRAFHGHTPLEKPYYASNIRWIDTCAAYPDRYPGAGITCVSIGPDGSEAPPVQEAVLQGQRKPARERPH